MLEDARRSAAEFQAALSNAEARLEEVRADQKVIYESTIMLQEQVKSCRLELESKRAASSQAREGSEALQKALDESLRSVKPRRPDGLNFLKSSWTVFLLP